jgi:AraC-like DNA-binding protein
MSEIAYEAGWSNPGHFTREFKKYYGKSPTQYRQIL